MMLRRYYEAPVDQVAEAPPVVTEPTEDVTTGEAEDQPKRRGRKPKVAEE